MDVNIKIPALEKLLDYAASGIGSVQVPCWRRGKLVGTLRQDLLPHRGKWSSESSSRRPGRYDANYRSRSG